MHEHTQQRRAEMLAAYAASPPGEGIVCFLARCGVARSTWYLWSTEPEFGAAIARIRAERATIDMEPFEKHLRAVAQAVVDRAVGYSDPAARMILESAGWLKPSTSVRITNTMDARVIAAPDDLGALLAERQQLSSVLRRAIEDKSADALPDE